MTDPKPHDMDDAFKGLGWTGLTLIALALVGTLSSAWWLA